jgi:hypothetical protein
MHLWECICYEFVTLECYLFVTCFQKSKCFSFRNGAVIEMNIFKQFEIREIWVFGRSRVFFFEIGMNFAQLYSRKTKKQGVRQ